MFRTSVDRIIGQFNKMIVELDTLVHDLDIANTELRSKLNTNADEMSKAIKVSNKLKEIVQ